MGSGVRIQKNKQKQEEQKIFFVSVCFVLGIILFFSNKHHFDQWVLSHHGSLRGFDNRVRRLYID